MKKNSFNAWLISAFISLVRIQWYLLVHLSYIFSNCWSYVYFHATRRNIENVFPLVVVITCKTSIKHYYNLQVIFYEHLETNLHYKYRGHQGCFEYFYQHVVVTKFLPHLSKFLGNLHLKLNCRVQITLYKQLCQQISFQ